MLGRVRVTCVEVEKVDALLRLGSLLRLVTLGHWLCWLCEEIEVKRYLHGLSWLLGLRHRWHLWDSCGGATCLREWHMLLLLMALSLLVP